RPRLGWLGGPFNGRDQPVAHLDLLRELTTEKLIDQTGDVGLVAEKVVEVIPTEDKATHSVLGSHGGSCRLRRQEGGFTDEVAFLQMRDLTTGDRDFHPAGANEE